MGCSPQNDRQQGDVVDDLGQRAEPGLFRIRVVSALANSDPPAEEAAAVMLDKIVDFAQRVLLDVAAARESLRHAGGVNIQLNCPQTTGQPVALKTGRKIQPEGVIAGIHARSR